MKRIYLECVSSCWKQWMSISCDEFVSGGWCFSYRVSCFPLRHSLLTIFEPHTSVYTPSSFIKKKLLLPFYTLAAASDGHKRTCHLKIIFFLKSVRFKKRCAAFYFQVLLSLYVHCLIERDKSRTRTRSTFDLNNFELYT